MLVSVAYILCLAASVRAVGDGHLPARQHRRRLPGRERGRLVHPYPRRHRGGRDGAVDRAGRGWHAGRARPSPPCCSSAPSRSGCPCSLAGSRCTTCSAGTSSSAAVLLRRRARAPQALVQARSPCRHPRSSRRSGRDRRRRAVGWSNPYRGAGQDPDQVPVRRVNLGDRVAERVQPPTGRRPLAPWPPGPSMPLPWFRR